MKCDNCGKEFGSGTNCQNCGIDRVTGLGNYSGYNNPTGSSGNYSSNYGGYTSSKTTVCYSCGEIIPSDSEYCPYCKKKLYETCPKCGATYSSQFKVCNKCGTDRREFLNRQRKEEEQIREKEKEQQYKKEAQLVKSELKPSLTIIYAPVAIIMFIFFLSWNSLSNFVSFIIPVLLFIWIAVSNSVCESIHNSKVSKWKQEHPNDPRCKYL
jgi:RNA polymerase subunit RPABC4/transcription elongation factor Spt4